MKSIKLLIKVEDINYANKKLGSLYSLKKSYICQSTTFCVNSIFKNDSTISESSVSKNNAPKNTDYKKVYYKAIKDAILEKVKVYTIDESVIDGMFHIKDYAEFMVHDAKSFFEFMTFMGATEIATKKLFVNEYAINTSTSNLSKIHNIIIELVTLQPNLVNSQTESQSEVQTNSFLKIKLVLPNQPHGASQITPAESMALEKKLMLEVAQNCVLNFSSKDVIMQFNKIAMQ